MRRLNCELYVRDEETFTYAKQLLGDDMTTTLRRALNFFRKILETEANGGYFGFVEHETSNLKKLGRFQRSFSTHTRLSSNRYGPNLRESTQKDLEKIIFLGEMNKREAVCRALDVWRDVLVAHEQNLRIVYKADASSEPMFAILLTF